MRADLHVVHLYPDLLRTYGDRGNVLILKRRAEWRGFLVETTGVTRGEPMPRHADLIILGGGADRIQRALADDLLARRNSLLDSLADGAMVLGVCGGYQLLGHRYIAADGTSMEGLSLLDVTTTPGRGRIIGAVRAFGNFDEVGLELVGFQNHGGRTTLGPAATPLAGVRRGAGNNGVDRTEGAVQGGVVGTYLHGPILAANPQFADALLRQALVKLTGGAPLSALDDTLEQDAHRRAARRLRHSLFAPLVNRS